MPKNKKKKTTSRLRFYWKALTTVVSLSLIGLAINFAYQIYQKPEEVLTVLPISSKKSIHQTWRSYREEFKEHAFGGLPPKFLAALTQVESAGDWLASPHWRWSWSLEKLYAPASTSFGVLQLTRPTAKFAAKLCRQKNGRVQYSKDGDCAPWFLNRASVGQSIEISTKNMVYSLQRLLGRSYTKRISRMNIMKTATLVHLCGERVARKFVKARFSFKATPQCGSHSTYRYWKRLHRYMNQL